LVLAAKCIARDQPPSKEESDDPARESSGRPPLLSDHEGWQALAAGDIDSAELHAHEMLAAADAQGSDEASPDDERHRAHVLLGYVCFSRNDLDGAEAELLRSSEVEATPVLGSFGPDLGLAWELLVAGRADAVAQFAQRFSRFWSGPSWHQNR